MRRIQLVNLARAYEIEVDPDATKDRILPALVAAEQSNVFDEDAKHPAYLLRAAYSPDDEMPQKVRDKIAKLEDKEYFHSLRSQCSKYGIKWHDMDVFEMERALSDAGDSEGYASPGT